jgi:hypothetical protein
MIDTAKKRGVTLLYWIPGGGLLLARKVAGESLSGLGADCTVKSARRSFVRKRRPIPPSGAPASSLKIVTGTSTLALVLEITYLRHSVATGNRRIEAKNQSEKHGAPTHAAISKLAKKQIQRINFVPEATFLQALGSGSWDLTKRNMAEHRKRKPLKWARTSVKVGSACRAPGTPRFPTEPSGRGSFTISNYIPCMESEYDPESEANAAMKLAVGAHGL